jgi:hypothetical protein
MKVLLKGNYFPYYAFHYPCSSNGFRLCLHVDSSQMAVKIHCLSETLAVAGLDPVACFDCITGSFYYVH